MDLKLTKDTAAPSNQEADFLNSVLVSTNLYVVTGIQHAQNGAGLFAKVSSCTFQKTFLLASVLKKGVL